MQHDERMDGGGYSKGLKRETILVVAMSLHRPDRPDLGIDRALLELKEARGVLLDATIIDTGYVLFRDKCYRIREKTPLRV